MLRFFQEGFSNSCLHIIQKTRLVFVLNYNGLAMNKVTLQNDEVKTKMSLKNMQH